MQFRILETERMLLREVNPEVFDYVFNRYNNYELMCFFGLKTAEELLIERDRFVGGIKTFNKSILYFHLIDKTNQEVIGNCGYHTWYLQHARAELFYNLGDDKYKRQGLMSEALIEVIKFGFHTMNLNRIEAFVGPTNIASKNVMLKFKFTEEGCLRKHYCKDNVYEDSLAYSLLRDEYDVTKFNYIISG